MRPVHFVLMLVLLTSLSGCLGGDGSSDESPGTYIVESTLTSLEVEAKSDYYQDGETVSWSVDPVLWTTPSNLVAMWSGCCSP